MSAKKENDLDELVSLKIQKKFDLIFKAPVNILSESFLLNKDISMSKKAEQKGSVDNSPKELTLLTSNDEMDFAIEFSNNNIEIPAIPDSINNKMEMEMEIENQNKTTVSADLSQGFDLEYEAPLEFEDHKTSKTIAFNPADLKMESQSDDLSHNEENRTQIQKEMRDEIEDFHSPLDNSEEAKTIIFSNITSIIQPDEFSSLDIETNNEFDNFTKVSIPQNSEQLRTSFHQLNTEHSSSNVLSTSDFKIDEIEDEIEVDQATRVNFATVTKPIYDDHPKHSMSADLNRNVTDEDSARLLGTIRQLREERENLINQVKISKNNNLEVEQDNLTLKASLDEAKIEVSILRKRHMIELEDVKYRLLINEEKKEMAEEKARQADLKREKVEQRVRIDYNQVKLREKELETKLEMLTLDVDSQVQSRDNKILELRRKIDSLEFNMENVSIKEHKTKDDKRKLEDKLNKIMKTLRHSIKNLEDDVDQFHEEQQDEREKMICAREKPKHE